MGGVFEKNYQSERYIGYKLVRNRECETQYGCRFDLNMKTYGVSYHKNKIWFCSSQEEAEKWGKHLDYIYMIKVEVDDYFLDQKGPIELCKYYTTTGVTRVSQPVLIHTDDFDLYKRVLNSRYDIPDNDRATILDIMTRKEKDKSIYNKIYILNYYKYKRSSVPDLFFKFLYGDEFEADYKTFGKHSRVCLSEIINIFIKEEYDCNTPIHNAVKCIYDNYDKIGDKGIEFILKHFSQLRFRPKYWALRSFFEKPTLDICKFICDKFYTYLTIDWEFLVEIKDLIYLISRDEISYSDIKEKMKILRYILTEDKEKREDIKKKLRILFEEKKEVIEKYKDLFVSLLEDI